METILYFDGGIRNKVMALGFVAYDMDSNEIFSGSRLCGKDQTSNISEYRALIAGLQASIEAGVSIIHIIGDSQLVIKQVTGAFKTNKEELRQHRDKARELLEEFEEYTIKWVPRNENKRADALVNEVFMKRKGNTQCNKREKKQQRKNMR